MYKDVHFFAMASVPLLKNPQRIRTDRDVRGSKQYRVRIANSQTTTVQGGTVVVVPAGVFCTLLVISEQTRMSVVFGRSEFAASKLVVGQHTGRYAVQQAISKRLKELLFSKALDIVHLFLGFISSFLYIFDVFAVYFSVIRVTQILTKTYIPQEKSSRVCTGVILGIIIYCFIRQFTTSFLSAFAVWMQVKQIN